MATDEPRGERPLFRALGPLEVGGEAAIGEAQTQAVLAYLLLHPNVRVAPSDLIQALWVNEPPPSAKNLVEQQISALLKVLPEGRLAKHGREPVHYELVVAREEIDIYCFEQLVGSAYASLHKGFRERASDLFAEALGLWRGGESALAYLSGYPRVLAGFESQLERRRAALLHKFEADLDCERYTESVAGLRDEVRANPRDEKFAQLLMRALYLDGQQPEALEAFEACKRDLDELGLVPGPALEALRLAILQHAEALQPTGATSGVEARVRLDAAGRVVSAWEKPKVVGRCDPRLASPRPSGVTEERVIEVLRRLHKWAESEEVLSLFDNWPKPLRRPDGRTYRQRFAELAAETEAWNYRQYRSERWAQLLAERQDDLVDLVFRAADRLGMRDPTVPGRGAYDLGIALGGARRAPLCRIKWLETACEGLDVGGFAFATSMRPIDDVGERPHTSYAMGAQTEFDLMHEAAVKDAPRLFGTGEFVDLVDECPPGNPSAQEVWAAHAVVRRYAARSRAPLAYGVAAPSANPREHRPRTPDTLTYLYAQMAKQGLGPGASLLLVTSAIYVPYQQIEALRVLALPYDVYVETIGFPREWNAPPPGVQVENLHDIGNYLQEIRSALQACSRLANDFPQGELRVD